jgi:hypothetical protein
MRPMNLKAILLLLLVVAPGPAVADGWCNPRSTYGLGPGVTICIRPMPKPLPLNLAEMDALMFERWVTEVPKGQVELFRLRAEGVQIYKCEPKKDNPKEFGWVLKEPLAELREGKWEKKTPSLGFLLGFPESPPKLLEAGKVIGVHSGGPSWKSNADGSKVVADMPPVVTYAKGGSIPWLLLNAKSHEGKGLFSKVACIQRIETEGGLAPAKCDESYRGTELRVPYKATYVFYGPKSEKPGAPE